MSDKKILPAAVPDTLNLVRFDEFGAFEITDEALLDLVAAGVGAVTNSVPPGNNGNCQCINSRCPPAPKQPAT